MLDLRKSGINTWARCATDVLSVDHTIHSMFISGTFKLRKTDYKKDGYDPSKAKKDRPYFLDSKLGKYREIDDQVFSDIQNGKIRI